MSQAEYAKKCKKQADRAYEYLDREFGIKKIDSNQKIKTEKMQSFVFICPSKSKKVVIE